jgi:hypothetical protein
MSVFYAISIPMLIAVIALDIRQKRRSYLVRKTKFIRR